MACWFDSNTARIFRAVALFTIIIIDTVISKVCRLARWLAHNRTIRLLEQYQKIKTQEA